MRPGFRGVAALALCAVFAARAVADDMLLEGFSAESSWLNDITYEYRRGDDEGTLHLKLGDDPTEIRYFEVPYSLWLNFQNAESPGAFYGEHIKQRYERQYGKSRGEKFDSPIPVQTQIDALCAFNEECEPIILQCIQKSQESIWVAAYAFTRSRIAGALIGARERGVRVEVKMDYHQAQFPGAKKVLAWMQEEGIPVTLIYTEGEYSAMHNKFMVFDQRWVITGSYNFTTAAQVSNWENLVWMDSPEMADQYKAAWDAIVSDGIPPPPPEPKSKKKK